MLGLQLCNAFNVNQTIADTCVVDIDSIKNNDIFSTEEVVDDGNGFVFGEWGLTYSSLEGGYRHCYIEHEEYYTRIGITRWGRGTGFPLDSDKRFALRKPYLWHFRYYLGPGK